MLSNIAMFLKLNTTENTHTVLGLRHWGLIVIVIFAVIPTMLIGLNYDQLYSYYLKHMIAPKLMAQFGFASGKTTVKVGNAPQDIFMLAKVDPDGVLGKKGILSGDIPTIWGEHRFFISGNENMFYYKLMQVQKGETVKIGFITAPDFEKYHSGNMREKKIILEGLSQ